VIPFLPLRHLPVVGLASRSYSFLGFRIVPGSSSGSGSVYEDDGVTTAYADGHFGYTTLSYSSSADGFAAFITPSPTFSWSAPMRSYQVIACSCLEPVKFGTLTLSYFSCTSSTAPLLHLFRFALRKLAHLSPLTALLRSLPEALCRLKASGITRMINPKASEPW
jgi:hypothetical protein